MDEAENSSGSSPVVMDEAENSSGSSPVVMDEAENRSGSSPVVMDEAESSSGSSPVVMDEAENSSGSSPVVMTEAENRSGSSPVGSCLCLCASVMDEAESSSGSSPVVMDEAENSSGSSPVVMTEAENRSGSSPVVMDEAESRSGSSPVVMDEAEGSSGSSPVGSCLCLCVSVMDEAESSSGSSPVVMDEGEGSGGSNRVGSCLCSCVSVMDEVESSSGSNCVVMDEAESSGGSSPHACDLINDPTVQQMAVLCCTETKVKRCRKQTLIPGYKMILDNRKHGLAIFVKEELVFSTLDFLLEESDIEILGIALHLDNLVYKVIVGYKPPTYPVESRAIYTLCSILTVLVVTVAPLQIQYSSSLIGYNSVNIEFESSKTELCLGTDYVLTDGLPSEGPESPHTHANPMFSMETEADATLPPYGSPGKGVPNGHNGDIQDDSPIRSSSNHSERGVVFTTPGTGESVDVHDTRKRHKSDGAHPNASSSKTLLDPSNLHESGTTLIYSKHEKVPLKDFSNEVRAHMDIKRFLNNTVLLLDLTEVSLDGIIDEILHKLLDASESKVSFDQARSALFTHDNGE
ncbi:HKR1-like protein [Mya arenaria]|uniref:HKR1-like protein n=1 Tax=Mya arenaria TaxID=6604 RepID=A0ABY7DSP2_MYAAR|nr:HKR1-like protein [Mya arenaria]